MSKPENLDIGLDNPDIGKSNNEKGLKKKIEYFDLLKILSKYPNGATTRDIQKELNLSYEPVHRYTKELLQKGYIMIYNYIYLKTKAMKQLLIKLSEEEYRTLEAYCQRTGRTKSAVVRYQISKLGQDSSTHLLKRKIDRIKDQKGKSLSELIREMRS